MERKKIPKWIWTLVAVLGFATVCALVVFIMLKVLQSA
jgi:hypothetical protein